MFHKQVNILVVFKKVEELGDIGAFIELPVDQDFLSDPLSQVLLAEILFVNDFQGIDLLRSPTLYFIDESSGSTA